MLDLTKSSGSRLDDEPELFMKLTVVRDPFTVLPRPVLIFNVQFGLPSDIGYFVDEPLTRIQQDWEHVGMTEFDIESRCLPFNDLAMAGFRRGEPLLWAWDPLFSLQVGRQFHSRFKKAMRDALAARTQKAQTIIAVMRDRNDPPHEHRSSNPNHFQDLYFDKVMGKPPDKNGEYHRTTIPFHDDKERALEDMYGFGPHEFTRNFKEEAEFYSYFYRRADQKTIEAYEAYVLEIMYRGHQRATAIEEAQRKLTNDLKVCKRSDRDHVAQLNGTIDDYKLTTYE